MDQYVFSEYLRQHGNIPHKGAKCVKGVGAEVTLWEEVQATGMSHITCTACCVCVQRLIPHHIHTYATPE